MQQIEQTLSSMEVAEMVEKTHKHLLRDIRRYCVQLNETKIEPVDFFLENSYKDEKGEMRPCYDITKKGCEFIAHKMTGTKGTAFTARYINRFHDMAMFIQQQQEQEGQQTQSIQRKEYKQIPQRKTWFERNNWKIKAIIEKTDWTRKYLYHKILNELSDLHNMALIEKMYINDLGECPKYKFDLIEYSEELQENATNYLNYLFNENIFSDYEEDEY